MPGNCAFNDAWLLKADFKEWLRFVEGNKRKARCVVCSKDIDISNMGEAALTSHMEGKKHKERLEIRKNTCPLSAWAKTINKTGENRSSGTVSGSVNEVAHRSDESLVDGAAVEASAATTPRRELSGPNPPSRPRNTMDNFVTRNDTLSAEVVWCLHVVSSHSSYKSSEGTGKLFHKMFPDSVIAKEFGCGESKCARLARWGIAPHFKKLLTSDVNHAEAFVLLFDESLNFENQKKQMDIHVRFWQHDQISTRYFGSEFLGKGDADHLVKSFLESVESLQLGKLLQIGMDGPNVNLKFHREMVSHIERNFDKHLLDIGSCGLHQIHGALKNAMDKNTVFKNLQNVFTSLYYLFDDAPARKTEYSAVTGSSTFGLQFCKHRWVENLPVARRALDIWSDVMKYVEAVQKKDKRVTKPTCKSYSVIEEATKDKMTVPMMQVYISICRELQPVLVRYQCDKPMIPFLGADLFTMIRSLIQRFGKADVVATVNSQQKMLKFDVKKKENLCDVKKASSIFVNI